MRQDAAITRRSMMGMTAMALIARQAVASTGPAASAPYRDPRLPTAARVRDLLARMTLEEKVAQMRSMWKGKSDILDATGAFSPARARLAIPHGIGQIARPGDTTGTPRRARSRFRSLAETIPVANAIQRYHVEGTRLGIPVLFHDETAHGHRARDATMFPIPPGLGSTWDPELVERVFAVVGRQARLGGTHVSLGPVVDLARDPRFGRVEEFFGEDPFHVSRMAIASVQGQQGARPVAGDKVFATLKHFVHGTPQGGLNIAPSDMSERAARETVLMPFQRTIDAARPALIMPSLNEFNGEPSHASERLLQRVGRERLGFDGAYFSDYDGIDHLVTVHHVAADDEEAALLALRAGVDADLPEGRSYAHLPKLVADGRVAPARIDRAAGRILALKFEMGLFEKPYLDLRAAVLGTNTPQDVALAREVAAKSIVLLKNDGLLPLDPARSLTLAVIGPNAEEPLFGGYSAPTRHGVGLLAGVRAGAGPNISVEFAEGVRLMNGGIRGEHLPGAPIEPVPPADNARRIAEAVGLANRSDVVLLVLGDTPETTREALSAAAPGDRSTLGLFGDQDRLVDAIAATGRPVVALLLNGRPLAVERLAASANALVEGWYLGQEGGNAFADILFGRAVPGGKLPTTFPRSAGSLPVYYNHNRSARENRYIEEADPVLFPFGHGLSYTSFELSPPRLSKPRIDRAEAVSVSVRVTNTGRRAGDEVVQLYIRDEVSSVPRPVLELRGFQRVTLAAGETREVTFELAPDALAFWDLDMNRSVEPGLFRVLAGNSSASLRSTDLIVT